MSDKKHAQSEYDFQAEAERVVRYMRDNGFSKSVWGPLASMLEQTESNAILSEKNGESMQDDEYVSPPAPTVTVQATVGSITKGEALPFDERETAPEAPTRDLVFEAIKCTDDLLPYTEHRRGCLVFHDNDCSCGLDKVLDAIDSVSYEAEQLKLLPEGESTKPVEQVAEQVMKTHKQLIQKLALAERDERIAELEAENARIIEASNQVRMERARYRAALKEIAQMTYPEDDHCEAGEFAFYTAREALEGSKGE